ncbi:hypothetical protein L3X38_033864 [Prunus dulcis]|uniref:Uncharacterized protein n=1 Tax=Prunus dulcis TaxID=3755 RepID=A0AAD4VHT6_PRUDU|nr:hypothetical protein L3X38_033864 [Prunus dulcis]
MEEQVNNNKDFIVGHHRFILSFSTNHSRVECPGGLAPTDAYFDLELHCESGSYFDDPEPDPESGSYFEEPKPDSYSNDDPDPEFVFDSDPNPDFNSDTGPDSGSDPNPDSY